MERLHEDYIELSEFDGLEDAIKEAAYHLMQKINPMIEAWKQHTESFGPEFLQEAGFETLDEAVADVKKEIALFVANQLKAEIQDQDVPFSEPEEGSTTEEIFTPIEEPEPYVDDEDKRWNKLHSSFDE